MLGYLPVLTSLLGVVGGGFIAWGALKSTVETIRKETEKLSTIVTDVATLSANFSNTHEEVGRLREAVHDTREMVQELQVEVKVELAKRPACVGH